MNSPNTKETEVARFDYATIERAHDVRHLRECSICGGIGDRRRMVCTPCIAHGRCFEARFGIDALLDLPKTETEKLTIGDIGVKSMKALVDRIQFAKDFNALMDAACGAGHV